MTREQAYEQVALKVRELQKALFEMREIQNPRTFGILELVEHLDDCLFDLQADLFEEDYE